MNKVTDRKRLKRTAAVLLAGMAAVFAVSVSEANEYKSDIRIKNVSADVEKSGLSVRFFDVGQGNAVLVQNNSRFMLIDGGGEARESYVAERLKRLGVKTLDYVIASHYDDDHLHGLIDVLREFECKTLLTADYCVDTFVYREFISEVQRKNLHMIYPKVGETYRFGDASFTIVCPVRYDHETENDNSIGLRLCFGTTEFLICADASEESEKEMLNSGLLLKSDVYMVNHHGSMSSTSQAFLDAVSPDAAVISAGYGGPVGHPAKTVMERLEKKGTDLYRTDLQGDLAAFSDGSEIVWNTEPSRDYRDGFSVSYD